MPHRFPMLFSPGRIGTLELPNRIVMAPMATSFAGVEGEVTEWMLGYYAERAKGGVGLIIIENANVDYPSGKSGTTQLRVDQDRFIPGLFRLAETIHAEGGRCALQINHGGAVARKGIEEGGQSVAPSLWPNGRYTTNPKRLSLPAIKSLISRFAQAARRARQAGFDAVEIHGGHGYLIGQFLSRLTNHRVDRYGGNREGRIRFAEEVLTEVRKWVGPDFPLLFRLNASDLSEGGLEPDDSALIAGSLAEAGADAIDLTVGTHYELNRSMCSELGPMSYLEGWRLDLVQKVKTRMNVPVIAVGPFREPAFAEQALQKGKVDFVALGRPLMADPEWVSKTFKEHPADIRRCISCNEGCVRARVFEDHPVSCTVNPEVGLEHRRLLRPQTLTRRILVVGGGPAGCAAAMFARERGHHVVLIEQNPELGGNCRVGSRLPGKEKLGWVVEDQRRKLEHLRVEVRLGTPFTSRLLQEITPNVLILAMGAIPSIPPDIRVEQTQPLYADNIIQMGFPWSGCRVAVIGGGALGCETALALARGHNEVVVLEALETAAREIEPISRFDLLDRLRQERRIRVLTGARVRRVREAEVHYELGSGSKKILSVDHIVWATGYRPRALDDLSGNFGEDVEVRHIGDCVKPRNILHAIRDGFWAGVQV